MRNTLLNQLVRYLAIQYEKGPGGWVSKGEITRTVWRDKRGIAYLPDTVGRALRSAEESSKIAVKYEGKNTLYKWLPEHVRGSYIPTSDRPVGAEGTLFRKGDYQVSLPL